MFTGLIKEVEPLLSRIDVEGGLQIDIQKPPHWNDLELGESIAINGICLTVTRFNEHTLSFFVGLESLGVTNIQSVRVADLVNLERSLTMGDRIGGHLVSGHVDGTALITAREEKGQSLWLQIHIGQNLSRWAVPKGSMAINGVSLTINELNRDTGIAEFLLIPETLERTNLKNISPGEFVNIECDQMVKIISEQVRIYEGLREQHP